MKGHRKTQTRSPAGRWAEATEDGEGLEHRAVHGAAHWVSDG